MLLAIEHFKKQTKVDGFNKSSTDYLSLLIRMLDWLTVWLAWSASLGPSTFLPLQPLRRPPCTALAEFWMADGFGDLMNLFYIPNFCLSGPYLPRLGQILLFKVKSSSSGPSNWSVVPSSSSSSSHASDSVVIIIRRPSVCIPYQRTRTFVSVLFPSSDSSTECGQWCKW